MMLPRQHRSRGYWQGLESLCDMVAGNFVTVGII
jgi:hypothetical protein